MRPAELGHAAAADGTHLGDAEGAVLVAVELDRLAPILQIGAGRMEERDPAIEVERLFAEHRLAGA